jgi:uncharacterized protein YraI
MKPLTRLCWGALAALLLAAPLATPARAENTVRATANLPIYDGPGQRYAVIGTLRRDARVALVRCTRTRSWCLFKDSDGVPVGWVRGTSLVGAAALVEATPFHFLVNPNLVPIP